MLVSKIKKKGNAMHNSSTITLLVFSTLFFSSLCINAETGTQPKETPITVSPTISPTFTPTYNNTPHIEANPHFVNEPQFINNVYSFTYTLYTEIKNTTIIWLEEIKKKIVEKDYNLITQLIKEMLWEYRYKIAGGTVIGSYSATSLLLLSDYHYLHRSTAWSRWKCECTFEDLCAIPQKDLARELLLSIGQHYYNEKNPTDLAHPLIQFIKNIDIEIRTIKRYLGTTKIIKKLHLLTIFPTSEKKIDQAQKQLERALFIKHIFLSWLSDYNLASNGKN